MSAGAIPARLRSAWSTGPLARLPFPGKGGARHELALPSHATESTGKRPDAWAVHWGRRVVFILEFTRPNDGADDWQTRTDAYKEERYRPLRDKLAALLPGWKVETIAFSLGIRGSFNEEKWRADLARLKVPRPAMDKLMHELVAKCLISLGDIYRTRQAALRV